MSKLTVREVAEKFAADPFSVGISGGAASFANGVFYSYAQPIARISADRRRAEINPTRYSVTTSKHRSFVAGALAQAGYSIVDGEF